MKKIFITGGSAGIGLALSQRFYREGFQTGICARKSEDIAAAKVLMPGLISYQTDMSIKEKIKALGKKVLEDFGCPNILINNAGVFLPGELHKEDDKNFEILMRTNVDSAYYFTKALVGEMIQRKSGIIVNMCSIASLNAYPGAGSYCISKFALLGFSKVLREELKPSNIKVISVLPGAVYTRSWSESGIDPERMMPAEDIAEAVWSACNLSERTVVEEIILRPQQGDI